MKKELKKNNTLEQILTDESLTELRRVYHESEAFQLSHEHRRLTELLRQTLRKRKHA